jgi:glutamine amidotransferase
MKSRNIMLLNLGWGNEAALGALLKRHGFAAIKPSEATERPDISGILIPGVGSFSHAMDKLRPHAEMLQELAAEGVPILGICLGMQLLVSSGEEGTDGYGIRGLGLIPGLVKRLPQVEGYPLPHVGWNKIKIVSASALWSGVPETFWQYFSNSYCLQVDSSIVTGQVEYSWLFPAAIECRNIFGVQFHPEKSGPVGEKILDNFMEFALAC